MGASLAALTFIVFLSVDWVLNRRKERASDPATAHPSVIPPSETPRLEPVWVGGYEFDDELDYHPGHTWVQALSPDTAVVGMDDFARRLIGKMDTIKLPKAGKWILQGSKSVDIETPRGKTGLLAPVEGEVLRVNRDVAADPEVASSDPYRRGWLYEVRSANLPANLRNLVRGSLARSLLEDAKGRLEHRLMGLSGTVLADGGEPANDYAEHLDPADWGNLTRGFLRN